MLTEDDKPSRLEHAKHEIMSLVDRLNGDRVGLIAFAGSALLISPMTSDHGAVKLYLSALSTNSVSTQGTNFKDVLVEAVRAFDRGGVEAANGVKPTRVLIIASDGEDNEHGAENQIKRALDQGVRIFTLGFGSMRGAPIPIRDERGNFQGYKKDRANQVVMSIPSDVVLTKLARSGGGSYYHSTFDEGELRNLVADVDKLQKVDFKTRMNTDYDEKFQVPLFLGILFSLLDLAFGARRKSTGVWRGRFGVQA
jgi:Ca-activated chloride channel family protein